MRVARAADRRVLPRRRSSAAAGLEQVGRAHQIPVALARGAASLVDGPDDQALSPAAVAGRKDVFDVRAKLSVGRLVVGALVELDSELLRGGRFRPQEPERQENQVAL